MVVIEPNAQFHVGTKAFIEKNRRLLILRQSDHYEDVGKWQLPGGRIGRGEEGKSLEDVLLREVQEECGADLKIKVNELFHAFQRQRGDGSWTFLIAFKCDYLSGDIELNDESTEFSWIDRSEIGKYEFVHGYREAIEVYFQKYQ